MIIEFSLKYNLHIERGLMKTLLRLLTNKIFMVGLIVIAEFAIVVALIWNLSLNYAFMHAFFVFLSVLLIIYITNRNDDPYYRLAWTIIILVIPPIGAVCYLIFGGKKVPKKLRERISDTYSKDAFLQDESFGILEESIEATPRWARLVKYLMASSHYPIYKNTEATYLASGEEKFLHMKEEIRKAEKFVFLEYFIIKEGLMWQELLVILRKKVEEGVDVRLMYDDWGCALFRDLKKQCEEAGIVCVEFNPLVARLAIQMNNRDHRKICVVDGRVGFIGGINLADEYINIGSKFGHWKDTAVMIEGDAVHSLTLMFLQFFRYYTGEIENPNDYKFDFGDLENAQGYVMPFADAPTDNYDLGLDAHLSMINNARDYIYIQTPYLIVGHEVIQALELAARSGVDVRIIVPHIPDKKIVNHVTKSNYQILIESGVRIYEYEPGFVHSKTFVADDQIALVGTTNMDFRSYYLHFECSILFINNNIVGDCYDDVMHTITENAIEITLEDCLAVPYLVRLFRSIARIFSGLM